MSTFKTAKGLVGAVAAVLAAGVAMPAIAADVQHLPVPKIVIYPGELISEEALADRAFNAEWSAKMPIHRSRQELVGKVARRTLLAGQPVPVNAIRVPDAVTQGKTYRIEYREEGLVISSSAIAMSSGAVGDLVSLRNPDSGMVVRGVVGADGTVRMSSK